MIAFIPVCKRERDEAESHAEATGVSAIGVGGEDVIGVAVEVGRGVAVGAAISVPVGEEISITVGTDPFVAVGEGREVVVSAELSTVTVGADPFAVTGEGVRASVGTLVAGSVGVATEIDVGNGDVDEAGTVVGFAFPKRVGTAPALTAGAGVVTVDIGAED